MESSFKISNILFLIKNTGYSGDIYIYLDSSKEKSILKFYNYRTQYSSEDVSFKLILNNFFDVISMDLDSVFIRTFSHKQFLGFNTLYFFDLNENYYVYIKKYYGNTNFYQYKKELDSLTEISKSMGP